MAFDSGTALNPNDLLDKLRLFLVAQGWTQDSWTTETGNQRLHLHKSGWYLNAKASSDGTNIWPQNGYPCQCIGLSLGTALNMGNAWYDQTGVVRDLSNRGIGTCLPLPSGAITGYLFFYDPAYESLVIYVQTATGVWRWAGFGQTLIKAGAWTGGAWIAGCADYYYANVYPGSAAGHGASLASVYPFGANGDSYYNSPLFFLRVDVDTFTSKWLSCSSTDYTGKTGNTNIAGYAACSTDIPALTGLLQRSRNNLNSLSVLNPVQIYAVRDAGGKSLLGSLPNIFASNVTGLAMGQPYTLGSNQYYPFPADAANRGTIIKRL